MSANNMKISANPKYSIVGSGVSGKALASLAAASGARTFVTEKGPVKDETRGFFKKLGIGFEENGHTERALEADALVLSSGIPPSAGLVEKAAKKGIAIIGELDFVASHLKGRIIGVTGSNGKTTTTALAGRLLSEAGFHTAVAGNIGTPIAECAFEEPEWIVAELSSFQLYWAHRFRIDIPVLTNIAPDHLDWHGTIEDYIAAKLKIFSLARPGATGICQEGDMTRFDETPRPAMEVFPLCKGSLKGPLRDKGVLLTENACYFLKGNRRKLLFSFGDVSLVGFHNIENAAMASAAAALAGVPEKGIARSLSGFRPLPHRCEKIAEIDGITYVDDSKGTNVAATSTALHSMRGPLVVILGGKGKGEAYGPLAEAVARNAVAAVLMGEEQDRIASALQKQGFRAFSRAGSMEEAVMDARNLAASGTTVILSPACTSWDMYENYEARGDHFKAVVSSLHGGSS